MSASQLTHIGTDQSPIITGHSIKIRTRWNNATKVKMIPANMQNVFRSMTDLNHNWKAAFPCARVDGLEPQSAWKRPASETAGHLSESDRATRCPAGKHPPQW